MIFLGVVAVAEGAPARSVGRGPDRVGRHVAWRRTLTEVYRPGVAPRGIGEGLSRCGRCSMDCDEASTIGQRLWQIRNARGKSLRVIGGLASRATE